MRTFWILVVAAVLTVSAPARSEAQSADSTSSGRSPGVATALGIVFPGGGHYYAGEPGRGALITSTTLALTLLSIRASNNGCSFGEPFCEPEPTPAADVLAFAALGVWALGAWDAHRAVSRRNDRVSVGAVVLPEGVGIQMAIRH
jgi:hypothetical protein